MQERDIFMDVLAGTKHSINCYTTAIMESSNQQLRSTFQTLRDEAEQMQYQIYQMAEQKGYYVPAPQANQNDVQHIKSSLSSSSQGTMGSNNKMGNMTSNTNANTMNNSLHNPDASTHAMNTNTSRNPLQNNNNNANSMHNTSMNNMNNNTSNNANRNSQNSKINPMH